MKDVTIDDLDRKILAELQRDAGQGLEALGEAVGLSRNAVWRRGHHLHRHLCNDGAVRLD